MLKVRQSYHGTGGKDGYKYKVYNDKGKKLGELKEMPIDCRHGDVVSISGNFYSIEAQYDSDNPRHERTEVVFYELKPYEFEPRYNLGDLIK